MDAITGGDMSKKFFYFKEEGKYCRFVAQYYLF